MSNEKHVSVVDEFYKPLITLLGCRFDELGVISENGTSVDVDKRTLSLPTEYNLANMVDTRILFHPLSENITRKDSPVFRVLRAFVVYRINTDIMTVAKALLEVATNPSLNKKLNTRQTELMVGLSDADAKTIKLLDKVLKGLDGGKEQFYNVYIKRNGVIGETSYNRAAIASFPLIGGLVEGDGFRYVWEAAKPRKMDYITLLNLFNSILPDSTEPNTYSVGSDSMDAPNFLSLVGAFVKVEKRLQKVVKIFDKIVNGAFDELKENQEFIDDLEKALADPDRYRHLIPDLDGNIGEIAGGPLNQRPTSVGVPPADLVAPIASARDAALSRISATPAQVSVQPTATTTTTPATTTAATPSTTAAKTAMSNFSDFNALPTQQPVGNHPIFNRINELKALLNTPADNNTRYAWSAELQSLQAQVQQFQQNNGFNQQFNQNNGFNPQFNQNNGFNPQFNQNNGFNPQFNNQFNPMGNGGFNNQIMPMTREQQLMHIIQTSTDPMAKYSAETELGTLRAQQQQQQAMWQQSMMAQQQGFNVQPGFGQMTTNFNFNNGGFGVPKFAGK